MPLYDYRCRSCGHLVEVMHPIGGTGPERCDVCGGQMSKLLSPPAIHFKGSGWAKKDARAASTASSAKRDEATPAAETKPAAEKPGSKDSGPADKTTKAQEEPTTSSAAPTGSGSH